MRGAGDGAACRVEGVSKAFGAVRAVRDVSFAVEPGSLTCLIGPNGAGKSTLLHCISGFLRHDAGRIEIEGTDVSRWPAHRRARNGLGTVFQTTRPLERLDVWTNAMVGCHAWTRSDFLAGILRPPRQRREEREIREASREALALVGLEQRLLDAADALPIGQLRLLSIARVLAQRPRVLLLDEPVAGLRAAEKRQLTTVFRDLRERGLTQVLVEHDMQFVGSVADRVIVLDRGAVIADGPPEQVRGDERVISAYLGTAVL
ncbi:MAG: ABC transporter ATP-binding protein [Actinobacteria bacterium]|nr:ABC transporter ATP-binding protein [Actinomycetota bacterium]